jgi:hypothetical protein
MFEVKIHEYDGPEHRDRGRYRPREYKTVCVYVELPEEQRPLAKGDIAGDFKWRRTHNAPLKPKQARELIFPILQAQGLEPKEVFYDRYAGCSMCPCSPGFTVRLTNHYYAYDRTSVWLTHRELAMAEMARQEAKEGAVVYQQEVAAAFGVC